ncbi:unnamed protein product [Tilletia caries]|nr:unnamed protein product [Tilletia caries]
MNSAAKTVTGGRNLTPSRSSNSTHHLNSKPSHDHIRLSPLRNRATSVAYMGSNVGPVDFAVVDSLRNGVPGSKAINGGNGLVASLPPQADASMSPFDSRGSLSSPSDEKGGSKLPKSPGTSRIAKLRAAWSPKPKITALPGGPDLPSLNPNQKQRGSKTFSVVPSRSKQRVSLGNIGSPVLTRFTTLNEHGEVVNYEPTSTGMVPLGNVIPLTTLEAAGKKSTQIGTGMVSSSNEGNHFPTAVHHSVASLRAYHDENFGVSPKSSGSNLRSMRHASIDGMTRSKSPETFESPRPAPMSPQASVRSPLARFRAVRERSATQGAYSSSAKDFFALPRTSADGVDSRLFAGRAGHTALDPVAELQGTESGANHQQAVQQARSQLLAPVVLEKPAMPSALSAILAIPSPMETERSQHVGADEPHTSLPTMWSQGTDISGYTASSESGLPVPDALGLVLSGSTRSENTLEMDSTATLDQISDSSLPYTSQGTPTMESTPSTLATACSPTSPRFCGGDHTFGSTAPRSPVHRRKVHIRDPSPPAESPSLDQILPDVELSTFGTPMPDADFESELVQAEARRQQRASSLFGNNMLGLSALSMPLEAGFGFKTASEYDGSEAASPLDSVRPPTATAAHHSMNGSEMSRVSTASTGTAARFQKKYMFEKVASPEQHRLLLEEEEWSCRGLQHEAAGQLFPLPPGDSMGNLVSRFSMSDDSQSGDHNCPSIYEVSSVEGSADGFERSSDDDNDDDHDHDDGSSGGSQPLAQSNSGWEGGSERAIFGLYADSNQGHSDTQRTSDFSPDSVIDKLSKRDTVESLLVRATNLLTDRAVPHNRLAENPIAASNFPPATTSGRDELDVDAELITEGLEPVGPADPITGIVTYQLKWKVVIRTRNGQKTAQQSSGICKVVSGVSSVSSPATTNVSLPSLQTPEHHALGLMSPSPATASLHLSNDGMAAEPGFQYSSQDFANPFNLGQRLRSSTAESVQGTDAHHPTLHLHAASYPSSRSTSEDHGDNYQHGDDSMDITSSPRSPVFLPKPLLLVQNTDTRTTSSRKRFDSNAEYISSPASKASSEFSRPSIGRDGRSVTSSPAMDMSVSRRRQLSYISIGRGSSSFDRSRAPSGSRSPYLSSTPIYVEDASVTPRSNNFSQCDQPRVQTPSLSTASGRLAAITGL